MSEVKRLLVVRGTLSVDDLKSLGLPFAHKYASADEVVLIDTDGLGFKAKGAQEPWLIEFLDVSAILRDWDGNRERKDPGTHAARAPDPLAGG